MRELSRDAVFRISLNRDRRGFLRRQDDQVPHRGVCADTGASCRREIGVDPGNFTVIIKGVDLPGDLELGMEAASKVDVVDVPAFLLVDDKGNELLSQLAVFA